MTDLYITNPSPEYRRWQDQPCRIVDTWPGDDWSPEGYVDVVLTGPIDPGIRLRIKASAVEDIPWTGNR